MTNDATNAIAAAPTTRSPNAGVGIGPLVPLPRSQAHAAGTPQLCRFCAEISPLTPSVRPDDRDSMIADVDDRRIGLRARVGPVGRTVTSSHTGVRETDLSREWR